MRTIKAIEMNRRHLLVGTSASTLAIALPAVSAAQAARTDDPVITKVTVEVNGKARALEVDTRTTLLDVARASASHRHQEGLRPRPVRRLHRAGRRAADQFVPDARGDARGRQHHHHRGAWHAGATCIRCRRPS